MRSWEIAAGLAMSAAVLGMTGCHVDESKHGDNKDVKIATPFGGMQVKTNDAVAPSDIGLAVYPGAVPVKKESGNGDSTAADVNMSFGSFQMRVKAATFRTDDAPEKVEAFYRDGLKHYGDVIACRDKRAVGTPTKTAEGLTCDSKQGNHIVIDRNETNGKLELKAGSQLHQHIVSLEPNGDGTKFGLIALDLPGKLFSDGGEDRQ
jgi:hypothetical protein